MRIKLVAVLFLLFTLSSCYYYRESMGTYSLPTVGVKEAMKEGKVCDNEDNYPFDIMVDLTVETARKRGEITNIIAIEKETSGSFIFGRKKCVIVRGN